MLRIHLQYEIRSIDEAIETCKCSHFALTEPNESLTLNVIWIFDRNQTFRRSRKILAIVRGRQPRRWMSLLELAEWTLRQMKCVPLSKTKKTFTSVVVVEFRCENFMTRMREYWDGYIVYDCDSRSDICSHSHFYLVYFFRSLVSYCLLNVEQRNWIQWSDGCYHNRWSRLFALVHFDFNNN